MIVLDLGKVETLWSDCKSRKTLVSYLEIRIALSLADMTSSNLAAMADSRKVNNLGKQDIWFEWDSKGLQGTNSWQCNMRHTGDYTGAKRDTVEKEKHILYRRNVERVKSLHVHNLSLPHFSMSDISICAIYTKLSKDLLQPAQNMRSSTNLERHHAEQGSSKSR